MLVATKNRTTGGKGSCAVCVDLQAIEIVHVTSRMTSDDATEEKKEEPPLKMNGNSFAHLGGHLGR